jgi:hypothetical protein
LKAKADVRAITFMSGILARRLMISSARPSLKYSFSLSPLMLTNGRTAIEAFSSSGGSADGLCNAVFNSSIDANRCPGSLARHRRTMRPRESGAIKGGGSSRRMALRTSAVVSPPNARAPDSIS